MNWSVRCADVLDWYAEYEGEPFHACLCDPSYGLGDNPDIEALLAAWLSGDDYDTGPGFMSKDWDVLPGPKYWAALRRVCHPGAYLFAFGGTRTADLLSVAIRLGGWERFDQIDSLSWTYAQGFPKNHHIGRAIDRENGNKREVVGYRDSRGDYDGKERTSSAINTHWRENEGRSDVVDFAKKPITLPASELAEIWNGHGTSMKPAHEPILCFRNPKQGTYAQNCTSTGAGALWIDGARVATGEDLRGGQYSGKERDNGTCYGKHRNLSPEDYQQPAGRWPPNVLLQHSPGCERRGVKRVRNESGKASGPTSSVKTGYTTIGDFTGERGNVPYYAAPDGTEAVADWVCVDGCPVAELSAQSGESGSNWRKDKGAMNSGCLAGTVGTGPTPKLGTNGARGPNDKGTAARFYPQFSWQYEIEERLAGVVPFKYQAKAGRKERDAGLEEWTEQEMSYMNTHNGDPDKGETWHPVDDRTGKERDRFKAKARNPHPTVKPIALCKWLATLLLPPPEYAPRRILIPFGGSGSEAIGAGLAGWDEIVMVEMEPDYVAIAEARLAHWLKNMQMELNL